MSKGKLYDELDKKVEHYYDLFPYDSMYDGLSEDYKLILDKAKLELPPGFTGQGYYTETDISEIVLWIKRWFGE